MIRRALSASCCLVALACPAHAADWAMDAAASRLEFAATFERAPAPGVFRQFETRMHFDADKPAEGRLEVTINVNSADMNSADVNKAIAGADWFDAVRFPKAAFRATEIRRTGADRYLARGSLNLKGVQQAIEVPFAWNESGDAARLEGEFTVQRGAFGIGAGEWLATSIIGADVKVKFSVRLKKGA